MDVLKELSAETIYPSILSSDMYSSVWLVHASNVENKFWKKGNKFQATKK